MIGRLTPLLFIAGGLLAGLLAERILHPALTRFVRRTTFRWDDVFVDALRGLLLPWLALAGLLLAAPELGLTPEAAGKLRLFVLLAYAVSLTVFAARFAGNLVAALSDHVASTSILRNVVRLCVYIAGALILLDRLGIAIAPLLTVLGVGGLAISLALKDTLSNLFAGMQIVASRHVRVGDMIKLESGEEGIVTDIQWRVTTVRTPLNTLVVVPNARFAEAIVTNCSRPTPEVLVRVPFAVGHGNDLERVERLALESGRETLRASAAAAPDFEPFVRFADWNESSVGLILVLKVREPGLEAPIRLEAIKRLHKTLASEGVALPYPVRTVRWEGPARAPEEVPGKPPEPR